MAISCNDCRAIQLRMIHDVSGPLPLKFFYFDCIECQVSLVCYNSGGGKKKAALDCNNTSAFSFIFPQIIRSPLKWRQSLE